MTSATYQGTVIAQSDKVEQVEGNTYFPQGAVNMSLLVPSPTDYTCPWKGAAQYYDLLLGDERIKDASWSYPDPKPAAGNIAGHFAFDSRAIEVG